MEDHIDKFKNELKNGLSLKLFLDRLNNLLPSYSDDIRTDKVLRLLLLNYVKSNIVDVLDYLTKSLKSNTVTSNLTCYLSLLNLVIDNMNIYCKIQQSQIHQHEKDVLIDNLLRLPTRISNLEFNRHITIPDALEIDNFYTYMISCYLRSLSNRNTTNYILERIHFIGLVRYSQNSNSCSFWSITLPYLQRNPNCYPILNKHLMELSLPQLSTYFEEFLFTISVNNNVKVIATLLQNLFSIPNQELLDVIKITLLNINNVNKFSNETLLRGLILWISKANDISNDLLDSLLQVWSSPSLIKQSNTGLHSHFSTLILLLIGKCNVNNDYMNNKDIIYGVTSYISSSIPFVRLLGMLVAQSLANYDGNQRLKFGDEAFNGDGIGRREIQHVINVLKRAENDNLDYDIVIEENKNRIDEEINKNAEEIDNDDDDDDSIQGFDISEQQLEARNDSDDENDDTAHDPTIMSKKKIHRPIYIAELNDLLRHDGKEGQEAASMQEVGLEWASALINDKREHRELIENSNNLTFTLLTLQDNFDISQFEELRFDALKTLVVSSPQRASLCIIQHLFSASLSLRQKLTGLTALGVGARELSTGIPIPPKAKAKTTAKKPIPKNVANDYEIEDILQSFSNTTINDARQQAGNAVPNVARERRFKINNHDSNTLITDMESLPTNALEQFRINDRNERIQSVNFIQISATNFVLPLINELWNSFNGYSRIRIDKEFLGPCLRTLAIMLWCSKNTPEFLHILSMESIELCLALPISVIPEATNVLLAVLTLSIELDGGLALSQSSKMPFIRRWSENAYQICENLNNNDSRISAAILIRVNEIYERFSTMILAMNLSVDI